MFSFFLTLQIGISYANQPDDSSIKSISKKLSSVEMQWEENKNAVKYQVQVFNSKNKLLKTFESKTSLLKFKSTSGKVKIRGRFLDSYGKFSSWSDLTPIEVPPDPVKFNEADQTNKESFFAGRASNKTMKGKVLINWNQAPQAKKYLLKVYDNNTKTVLEKISNSTSAELFLEAGSFTFSITSIGNEEVMGKESFSPKKITVSSAQISDLNFEVANNPKNENQFEIKLPQKRSIIIIGKLEYSYHMSERIDKPWKLVGSLFEVKETIWSPPGNLTPGKYKISFWGRKDNWQDSIPFEYEFTVKPTINDLADINPN
ncbi:MAG: hypothetical protein L6Q37_00355 [Bdellovibrionaceae bacterium]|nr:hypothetical protein [Pseudobdellovibrionaceae bacterium]NUM58873.1 hypothetical protein [Pseudobdellovibrionaceae bacterium]